MQCVLNNETKTGKKIMNSFQEHYKCVAIGKRVQVIKNTDAGRKVGDPQPRYYHHRHYRALVYTAAGL